MTETKSKVEDQIYLKINEGYEINHLLKHTRNEGKKAYISGI